jgi:hypothetical protein
VQPRRAKDNPKQTRGNPGVGWHDWFGVTDSVIGTDRDAQPKHPAGPQKFCRQVQIKLVLVDPPADENIGDSPSRA